MDDHEPIIPAPGRGEYYLIRCPVLGRRRSSLLCESTCHNMNFATKKVQEERSKCGVFPLLDEYREKNPLPTWHYEEE